MYVCVCVWVGGRVGGCDVTCECARACTWWAHSVCLCVCVYVYMCMCICVCVYVYVCARVQIRRLGRIAWSKHQLSA